MPGRLEPWRAAALCGHRQRIEYLETRRLLNAAGLASEPPAVVWAAASQAVNPSLANHFTAFEGLIENRAAVAAGLFVREPAFSQSIPGSPDSSRLAAFDKLDELRGSELAGPPLVEVIVVAPPPFPLAGNAVLPELVEEADDVSVLADGTVVNVDLIIPAPANASSDAQMISSHIPTVEAYEIGRGLERALFFAQDTWEAGAIGMFAGPDAVLLDAHSRAAELLRAPPAESRLAMWSLDGVRSSNGALAYFDPAAEIERHATAGFAVIFGQSAEDETAWIAGGAVGGALPTGALASTSEVESVGSVSHSASWYLMAFDAAMRANIGVYSAAIQGARKGGEQAVPLVREVLAPCFAFDTAALTVALNDLAAEADELRQDLLEMLSPVASGEAAAIAVTLAAGLAYRHWRTTHCERPSEEQRLLLSRFTRGHASIRIGGGPS